jgi:hypothetical protein
MACIPWPLLRLSSMNGKHVGKWTTKSSEGEYPSHGFEDIWVHQDMRGLKPQLPTHHSVLVMLILLTYADMIHYFVQE